MIVPVRPNSAIQRRHHWTGSTGLAANVASASRRASSSPAGSYFLLSRSARSARSRAKAQGNTFISYLLPLRPRLTTPSVKIFSEQQLQRFDIDTLRRMLRSKLGGYIIAVKDVPAHHLFYRAVRCEPRPDTIRRISYPPAEMVTTFQRVNRAAEPRFYCSVSAPAVFYELHAKQGEFFALSKWELVEPLWLHNLGYHPLALVRMGAQRDNITMRQPVTHSIPNEPKGNRKLRHQLSLAFTADVPPGKEYRYKLSIAIDAVLVRGSVLPLPKSRLRRAEAQKICRNRVSRNAHARRRG